MTSTCENSTRHGFMYSVLDHVGQAFGGQRESLVPLLSTENIVFSFVMSYNHGSWIIITCILPLDGIRSKVCLADYLWWLYLVFRKNLKAWHLIQQKTRRLEKIPVPWHFQSSVEKLSQISMWRLWGNQAAPVTSLIFPSMPKDGFKCLRAPYIL